ncbi:HisA/HisF-related TIM barrel protein [Allorhodopirellula solitaria]|uniref:Histidine biosynthesis protein n=1 Tax=Allorhodopirellula solitaria TaxID=2527987 RepID=A0A5C5YE49_9BACT|nr:HisA/HisF-related TIM barrel protein [Allorhodopirellula solitaria]TWT73093.1 Histidine biosynthesis protein [Allorhodopirellula solitaria]
MRDRSDWASVVDHLVGVIDLQDGVAVHGIAGNRQHYAAVKPLRRLGRAADGDPLALVDWYRSRLPIRQFYIADLDALQGKAAQHTAIESLISCGDPTDRWLVDVGMSQQNAASQIGWIERISARYANVNWIIASESATSSQWLGQIAESLSSRSLILGLDFRDGVFVGPPAGLDDWLIAAQRAGLRSGMVLDVATVGTGAGPRTADLCGDFHERLPAWQWISGGGCRHAEDVKTFLNAGCQNCLVASALLPA